MQTVDYIIYILESPLFRIRYCYWQFKYSELESSQSMQTSAKDGHSVNVVLGIQVAPSGECAREFACMDYFTTLNKSEMWIDRIQITSKSSRLFLCKP